MLRLTATTTDLVSLITAQNGAKVFACYNDRTATAYGPGANQATSVGSATTTTIVSTPGASTTREVDYIGIKNTFAGPHTMTVQASISATVYPFKTFTLLTDESIEYTHARGWVAMDANANVKETTTSINSSAVLGTTTNDSAAAGRLGEYLETDVPSASAVALTTDVSKTVASVSLTAGDWNVWGFVGTVAGGTVSYIRSSISQTNNTLGTNDYTAINVGTVNIDMIIPTQMLRISLSATTTIYLVARIGFGTSMSAFGRIMARRMR